MEADSFPLVGRDGPPPTHVLHCGTAHPIRDDPLVVGVAAPADGRGDRPARRKRGSLPEPLHSLPS